MDLDVLNFLKTILDGQQIAVNHPDFDALCALASKAVVQLNEEIDSVTPVSRA
jgi:hypothetical protein